VDQRQIDQHRPVRRNLGGDGTAVLRKLIILLKRLLKNPQFDLVC